MNESMTLEIIVRSNPNKADNKRLKQEGYLLGNISGRGTKSVSVAVIKDDLKEALKKERSNKLFTLESENNESFEVKLKEVQIIEREIGHLDFILI